MMPTPPPAGLEPPPGSGSGGRVALTRWSVVARAAKATDDPECGEARSQLCRAYWYPLYVYLRRKGCAAAEAEDLVQAFFAEIFEKNLLDSADAARGRFRTFLLVCLDHFIAHQRRHEMTVRRGGGWRMVPLETAEASRRYEAEPRESQTAEAAFDRAWAIALLSSVLDELEAHYADRPEWFAALRPYLSGEDGTVAYANVAQQLDMTPLAVRVAVHRLRGHYRAALNKHLAATVDSAEEIVEERAALFRALAD